VGDHSLGVAPILSGSLGHDGARIEVNGLAGRIELCAGNDRLEGGLGDDRLLGDSDIALTGLVMGASSLGNRSVEVNGLLCDLDVDAGCDLLLGEDGHDSLAGDNALSITGVLLAGVAADASAGAGMPLVEVSSLVDCIDICGRDDTLDGGAGDDVLIGDHVGSIAGVAGSAGAGQRLRIEIECTLIDCLTFYSGKDKLTGGLGDDLIVGDNSVEVAAVAAGAGSGSNVEIDIDELICNLRLKGASDQGFGSDGDDALIGDHVLSVTGLVLTDLVDGRLDVEVDSMLGSVTLESGSNALDGGNGNDWLIGDHVVQIGAVLDSADGAGAAAPAGTAAIDIHELIGCLDIKAGQDTLKGGTGDDLLQGDSNLLVAAYLGMLDTPIAAGVQVTGERLVVDIDQSAAADKLYGGDGDDTLVGDNDVTAAFLPHADAGPEGTYGLDRLVGDLWVGAASDSLSGDKGANVVEHGNRASTPSGLVKSSKVSSLSKLHKPGLPPLIDWNGAFCDGLAAGGERTTWVESFVNGLGQANPNSTLRIKL
jgi:Ca2+-binding RTX toxin-like protein